jgi:hypothetical protein
MKKKKALRKKKTRRSHKKRKKKVSPIRLRKMTEGLGAAIAEKVMDKESDQMEFSIDEDFNPDDQTAMDIDDAIESMDDPEGYW